MIVSFTVLRYPRIFIPMAFLAMAIHRLPLMANKKCRFWKLMGSGNKGSFDLKPDLQQWVLLAVWEKKEDFDEFYHKSFVGGWWKRFTKERWTLLCTPLKSHGAWDGRNPFVPQGATIDTGTPVAVLTRATIRPTRLRNFWSNIDRVSQIMAKAKGYILSFGVGEAPLYRQATFSVWETEEDVKNFAYGSREHREVINKTRDEGWYSEELFARFKPIESFGTLGGKNPLNLDPVESFFKS